MQPKSIFVVFGLNRDLDSAYRFINVIAVKLAAKQNFDHCEF
jgi:hypothetical protein